MSINFVKNGKFPERLENMTRRLKFVVQEQTNSSGRFAWLESVTGIGQKTWQAWWTRDSMPSGNMIEAVGRLWPQYAFWLCTGMTDENCGHSRPNMGKGWPEYKKETTRQRTNEYFEYCSHMQHIHYGSQTGDLNFDELKKRLALRQEEIRLLDNFEEKEAQEKMNSLENLEINMRAANLTESEKDLIKGHLVLSEQKGKVGKEISNVIARKESVSNLIKTHIASIEQKRKAKKEVTKIIDKKK